MIRDKDSANNHRNEVLFDVRGVFFSYAQADDKVLDDLNVTFNAGKMIGIVGPNGCGKTTLLDLLVGYLKPKAGEILFRDKLLNSYVGRDLAKEIALVSQNYYINFPYTVEEIVMMGRHPYIPRFGTPSSVDYDHVETAMEKADVIRFRHRHVTELSGGERQRVVFARALAQDTPVLFLDEATSNLDIGHTLALMNLVAGNVRERGRTVISVFQDINLAAMYCEDLILLKDGRLQAAGPTSSVLTPDNIQAVFGVVSTVVDEPFSNSLRVAFRKEEA